MYFYFLAIVSYYVVTSTAAAWLIDKFAQGTFTGDHARPLKKVMQYIP
jgi:hypothetical protein